eukprot:15442035-Alexandrium_andersonii.AAC.1
MQVCALEAPGTEAWGAPVLAYSEPRRGPSASLGELTLRPPRAGSGVRLAWFSRSVRRMNYWRWRFVVITNRLSPEP